MDTEIKIKVPIAGKQVELSPDEARALRDSLIGLLGDPRPFPQVPYFEPFPQSPAWWQNPVTTGSPPPVPGLIGTFC